MKKLERLLDDNDVLTAEESGKILRIHPVTVPSEADIIDAKEAAALLKVHPITLRRKAVAWGVPHRRLGTEWRFSRKRLIEWIQEAA